jgi:hypothetical protein
MCGKFGSNLFKATVLWARQKNAGMAGPGSRIKKINRANATIGP